MAFGISRALVLLLVSALLAHAFNCPALPAHTPRDISDLMPSDIKVMMALGDSVTAAFGLQGASGLLNEYRGQSWAIGGDPNATTLPNFFKHFSPNIVGPSLGKHLIEICYGPLCPPYQYRPSLDVLNAAQSGAMITNLLKRELPYLLKELNNNPQIDMANDWKVLTIFIGANDLCMSCVLNKYLSPSEYGAQMAALIEQIRVNIPRVFVNLVPIFNLSGVYDLSLKSNTCKTIHRVFFVECECVFGINSNKTRVLVDQYSQAYNQEQIKIANHYRAQNFTDFAVVIQPALMDLEVGNLTTSFLSTLDCFHPSLTAHQTMATGLWNSMFIPVGQKPTSLDPSVTPICPTASMRLQV